MNKLLFSLLVLIFGSVSAQELSNDQKQMLKFDNTARFSDLLSGYGINQCYNIQDNSYTLLSLAIKMKSIKIFQKIIDEKADLEKICDGKTALMFAVKYGDVAMVKKLLENGAKKETKTEKGLTALNYAEKYHPEMMELLK